VVFWLLAPAGWRLRLAVIGGLIAGTVMGYARVSLGVHWPTDTLGGTLLGLGWFAVTAALVWPRLAPWRARSPARKVTPAEDRRHGRRGAR
jgi:undecaprenyl-diphosphatase